MECDISFSCLSFYGDCSGPFLYAAERRSVGCTREWFITAVVVHASVLGKSVKALLHCYSPKTSLWLDLYPCECLYSLAIKVVIIDQTFGHCW